MRDVWDEPGDESKDVVPAGGRQPGSLPSEGMLRSRVMSLICSLSQIPTSA